MDVGKEPGLAQERVELEQERRPELSAESFSRRMRVGLLLITLIGELVIFLLVVAAAVWPRGMLDASTFAGAYTGGIALAIGFFLMVIYGGLVGNNERLSPRGRTLWFLSFVFFGPIALPAYWFIHVSPAPYEPWTDAHAQSHHV